MATALLTKDEELHWLALRMVPGLGAIGTLRILERLRTPEAIFRASPSELEGAGVSPSLARSIASGVTFEDAVEQQQRMLDAGARMIPYSDPLYPPSLREIFDPPTVLFVKGRVELLQRFCLAVVGTRRPTPYGLAATEHLSADLAKAGLVIVSGMARGVDTAAHQAALKAGGDTLAVFGCGVDLSYPTENRRLYETIAEKGLMISEFPMGAPAFPQNFPIRNRIVSGLSEGVLIIEGAQYSGSAITARLATDQGREVFAVPGNITSRMSWGPNLLIKQGAKLVQEWTDVTNELPTQVRRSLTDHGQQKILLEAIDAPSPDGEPPSLEPLQQLARKILSRLQVDIPQQLDTLLESFDGASSSELIAALFDLEMNGLIRQLPGKNFVKVW
ncbi:MAG: DNA-processing protein DprA [Bryobacteraceae bacterium]